MAHPLARLAACGFAAPARLRSLRGAAAPRARFAPLCGLACCPRGLRPGTRGRCGPHPGRAGARCARPRTRCCVRRWLAALAFLPTSLAAAPLRCARPLRGAPPALGRSLSPRSPARPVCALAPLRAPWRSLAPTAPAPALSGGGCAPAPLVGPWPFGQRVASRGLPLAPFPSRFRPRPPARPCGPLVLPLRGRGLGCAPGPARACCAVSGYTFRVGGVLPCRPPPGRPRWGLPGARGPNGGFAPALGRASRAPVAGPPAGCARPRCAVSGVVNNPEIVNCLLTAERKRAILKVRGPFRPFWGRSSAECPWTAKSRLVFDQAAFLML